MSHTLRSGPRLHKLVYQNPVEFNAIKKTKLLIDMCQVSNNCVLYFRETLNTTATSEDNPDAVPEEGAVQDGDPKWVWFDL